MMTAVNPVDRARVKPALQLGRLLGFGSRFLDTSVSHEMIPVELGEPSQLQRRRPTLTLQGMEFETESDQAVVSWRTIGKRRADSSTPVEEKVESLRAELSLPGGNNLTLDGDKALEKISYKTTGAELKQDPAANSPLKVVKEPRHGQDARATLSARPWRPPISAAAFRGKELPPSAPLPRGVRARRAGAGLNADVVPFFSAQSWRTIKAAWRASHAARCARRAHRVTRSIRWPDWITS
jgi:hypothetical protein